MSSRILLLAVPLLLTGCPEASQTCSYPVTDPDRVVVALAHPLPLLARTQLSGKESPLGNALADSYRKALQSVPGAPSAVIEVVSSIRDDGVCPLPNGVITRTTLSDDDSRGEVTARTLRNAMPGPDRLVAVQLTLSALFNILEHGVTGPVGEIEKSSGRFVLVSGLDYTVDCNEPPEGTTQIGVGVVRTMEGRRVRSLHLGGRLYTREDARANTAPVAIAMPESLARGGDQFFDLRDAFAEQGESAWSPTGVETYPAFEGYLAGLGAAVGGRINLRPDGRISFVNCSSQR